MLNNDDFKKNIVIPAWEVIKNDLKLKRFYFLPGLVGIIALTTILLYQSIYTYVVIFHKKDKALEVILKFFHSDYFLETIIGVTLFILIYLFIIPIFEGGLIKYLDEKRNGVQMSTLDAIGFGVCRFLPMFEYSNVFSEFKYISILNAYLFLIRFVGLEYIKYINYIMIFAFVISTFINIMFAYAKYEIILKNKGVFQSIAMSMQISILNLKNTLRLYMLMFLINIRVLLNFLVFLFFPILIVIALSYITTKLFLALAIIMILILFIFFLLLIGYLTAVLDVFKTSIWYFAYVIGRERVEKDNGE
ncbi:hypothetical protein EOM39_03470 [Candidatus Gracilibacteria bacterium]|nr:hypothetical protein [Candidatus Gracilibacteria bacterium]